MIENDACVPLFTQWGVPQTDLTLVLELLILLPLPPEYYWDCRRDPPGLVYTLLRTEPRALC